MRTSSHSRHRASSSRARASTLERVVFVAGLAAAVASGVAAYRVVGLYGNGAFSSGFRGHTEDPVTGRMLLVHETRTSTGVLRRLVDPTAAALTEVDVDVDATTHARVHVEGGNVTVVEVDRNGDGRTDSWEYYDAQRHLVKVGVSLANDGVLDAWGYRDKDGQIVKMEVSTRRDGKVDRWEYYEKGQLSRVEEDRNHDGRVDHWSTYDGGILMSTTTTPP